jgi:hypothetical protein
MKILSWDVGIKNLAYCIMEKQNNNDIPYKIHNWGNINIIEQTYLKCIGENCKRKVLVTNKLNNQFVGYCAIHKREFQNFEPEILECINPKCQFSDKCKKKATASINNINYCTTHKKNIYNKIIKNQEFVKYKPPNCKTVDIKVLKKILINLLDKKKDILLNVNHCVIENQPSLKNPKMKSIAETLYNWFLIRGQIDNITPISNLTYMCPSNKLKVNEDNTISILKKSKNDTEKYKLTKQLGIIYCKQLLINDHQNLNFLIATSKKDDLCDAFLQGAYYLEYKL